MPRQLQKVLEREVPQEWRDMLATISKPPRTAAEGKAQLGNVRSLPMSYLHLIWEGGYPWEPVERYVIYQMIPRHAIMPEIREQLEHPLPPSQMGNYFDVHMNNGEGEFVRNPDCLITERAYWLYQETGYWGRPFWVIQGEQGGHKRWFTPVEKKLLRLKGLPTEPPEPGDLPYAPFDQRVMDRLVQHDLLRGKYGGLVRRKTLLHGAYSSRQAAEERACREELVTWLTEQVTEFAPDVHRALMKLDAPRTRGGDDQRKMEERSERAVQNYIETGKSHGGADPSRIR